ncbi:MAG: FIST C-terminal domain-containing protein [Nitrospira sp.]|nr:FIST C-terminal domain-containing protein [Nitrospira sp.]MDR4467172.1 FIST C-terminal domain-containing protein [Nitrospira sp.]
MELHTLGHDQKKGWSVTSRPRIDSRQTLVVVFGSTSLLDAPGPMNELLEEYGESVIVGCSTAGEIFGTQIFDESLSAAIARFEHTNLRIASAPVRSVDDSFKAGQAIAQQLKDSTLRGILVLSDGLSVNGSELVRGLNSTVLPSVVVTGGLAGDGNRFQRTWVLQDRRPQSGWVTAVGFYGNHVRIGHGSKGGWDLFGPERRVTKSKGNVLLELDGRPALQLYKEYLGDRAAGLPATGLLFPLALRADQSDSKSLVRTILAVSEEDQSLTFAGDIPEGSLVQLMKANFDRLVQGASEAATTTKLSADGESCTLAIAISCVGRRLVLGERTEEETEATLEVLPKGTQQIGFYSYGEISPYATGACDLHNQTMTLTTLSEAA